tara:strand:- start:165 stop:761 length:597 start_codon:yes stop_codon:yes gene_type:complete
MFLKNEICVFNIFIIIFLLFSPKVDSASDEKTKILSYLNELRNFSASFLQTNSENLSEGKVFVGNKRVRAEYFSPTKILIILDEDKGMYYNYELEEDEFFNPKNTNAWFFYDIFRNPLFFEDGLIETKNNELILTKNGVDIEERKFQIKVYFEKSPLVLRAVQINIDKEILKLSIYNHNYNEEFDKNLFKLINPKFFD